MTVTYITDLLNHHLIPLAQEFFARIGDDFHLIETKDPRVGDYYQKGYAFYAAKTQADREFPWRVQAYIPSNDALARELALRSDVVIIGNASDEWIMPRLRKHRLTFRAHERWYRKGLPWYKKPKAMIGGWLHHGRFKSLYLLSASAYTAADAFSVGCFRGKAFWWGYFSRCLPYPQREREPAVPRILWAGRMIPCKRAGDALRACAALLKDGARFTLDLVGSGPEYESLRQLIPELGLDGIASLLGEMPPEDVRREMQRADIFVFTSDFQEGWGSVLNEAMSSGCAVVASHAAGATPLLVQSGVNGLVYPSGDIQKLAGCIRFFLENPDKRAEMSAAAYQTVLTQWSAQEAAGRFLTLSRALMQKQTPPHLECGPCAAAAAITNQWITENGIEEEN